MKFCARTIIVLLLLVVSYASPALAFEDVTPLFVQELLKAGEEPFVLDVRQPEEYAEGYVPTAYLIPLGTVPERLDEIPRDRDVVVVCQSGGRSAIASQQLTDAGFDRILNMLGGTLGWQVLPAYLSLKPRDLLAQLEIPGALLVDVRPEAEYSKRHIDGAVSIPLDDLEQRLGEIPQESRLIVVGEDGIQGAEAAEQLVELGYSDVLNLEDGMLAWDGVAALSAARKLRTTLAAVKR